MELLLFDDIHEEYRKLIEERCNLYLTYFKEYNGSYNRLNDESRNKLKMVFNKYKESYNIYKKILNFIIFNSYKINYDDVFYVIDLLDEKFEDIIIFITKVLDDFNIASSMKLDYKFNVEDNNVFLNNSDFLEAINYVKGFNMDSVTNYLIDNDIYTIDSIDDVYNKVKFIDCSRDDYFIYSGVNDNKDIMIPKVKDELSTLISIHELVHKALLLKDVDDSIKYSEVLPIFYELLFKKYNKFCKEKIHDNELANKLIDDYHNEPFEIQIKKLKKIVN